MTTEIPSPQPAPAAYSIQTLTDMLKVPPERRGAMLRELETALLTHELAFGDEAQSVAANMTWTDDGDRTVDITANGKPLLTLKVQKKAGAIPSPEGGELTDDQLDAIADAHRWDTREGRRAMLRAALAAQPVQETAANVEHAISATGHVQAPAEGDEPFLKSSAPRDEVLAAAMDLDAEVRQIANGKRKPGKLSLEKLAIVIAYARTAGQPQPKGAAEPLSPEWYDACIPEPTVLGAGGGYRHYKRADVEWAVRAAVAAYAAQSPAPAPAPLAVPFGMALVPREPTEDMLSNVDEEVGGHCHSCSKWSASWDDCRRVWAAMVAAAPVVAPLTLETAAEARKDREHAEAYYRQAEKLLTANEQTLHAEVQRLTAELAASSPAVAHRLKAEDVQWIVNDIAELGVMIHGQAFFLYKGHSLVYEDATHDETGEPMRYRPVFKREFGECAHPINYENPTLIGTVSLDDSDEWRELPPAHPPVQGIEP